MKHEKAVKEAIEYCRVQGILRLLFGQNSTEKIVDMMMVEMCRNEILEYLESDGSEEGMITAAKNAFSMGLPVEVIHNITGLDIGIIQNQN